MFNPYYCDQKLVAYFGVEISLQLHNRISWVPNLEGRKNYALVRANMSNYIIFTSHNKQ